MNIEETIISEGKTLATDLLLTSKDSIEKGLHRTKSRILGTAVGTLLLGFLATPILVDALTDKKKLAQIAVKLENLDAIELDESSQDYEKAKASCVFQKQVYQASQDYTETARKVKLIAGLAFAVYSIGVIFPSFLPINELPTLHTASTLLTNGGLLVGIPSALYGIYHRLHDGAHVDSENKTRAQQALHLLQQP